MRVPVGQESCSAPRAGGASDIESRQDQFKLSEHLAVSDTGTFWACIELYRGRQLRANVVCNSALTQQQRATAVTPL